MWRGERALAIAGALLLGCDAADPSIAAGAGTAVTAAAALGVALRRRGKERVARRWIALSEALGMEVAASSSPLLMTGAREGLDVRVEAHGADEAIGLPATRVAASLREPLPPALVPPGEAVPLDDTLTGAPLRRGFLGRVASHDVVEAARELGWSTSLRADAVWLSTARFLDDAEELELVLAHACRIALRVPRVIGEVPPPMEARALADGLSLRLDDDGRGLRGMRGERKVRIRLLQEVDAWTIHVELELSALPRKGEILLLDRRPSSLPLAPAEWGIEARLGGPLERIFRARGIRAGDFDLLTDPVRAVLLRLPPVGWIRIAALTVVALRVSRLELETIERLVDGLVELAAILEDTGEGSPYRTRASPRGDDDDGA